MNFKGVPNLGVDMTVMTFVFVGDHTQLPSPSSSKRRQRNHGVFGVFAALLSPLGDGRRSDHRV